MHTSHARTHDAFEALTERVTDVLWHILSPGGSHGGEDGKQGPKVRVHGLSVQDTHTHTRDETKGATRCVHTKQALT